MQSTATTSTVIGLTVACLLHACCAAPVPRVVENVSTSVYPRPSTTLRAYLTKLGYPFEEHSVTTSDGYILQLHRIPQASGAPSPAPVVFLQHGILASSWCWLVNEEERAPGLALWHRGYDIWLGNSRGNTFSRNHTTLPTDSAAFWNFTFADMPKDIAAAVPYATSTAGVSNLSYVGWSQANTAMLIAGSSSSFAPMLRSHINVWAALSPVSFMHHSTSPLLSAVSKMHLGAAVMSQYPKGFLTGHVAQDAVEQFFCRITAGLLCKLSVDTVCGVSHLDDTRSIEAITSHFPAGTSVKDLVHYEQFIGEFGSSEGEFFGAFNYGAAGNQQQYNNTLPPAYNLTSYAGPPVALFAAGNDALVNMQDYHVLEASLPRSAVTFNHTYQGFSHLTWLVGSAAAWPWFEDLAALLASHSPAPASA